MIEMTKKISENLETKKLCKRAEWEKRMQKRRSRWSVE